MTRSISYRVLCCVLALSQMAKGSLNDVGIGLSRLNVRQIHAEPTDVRRFGNVTVICTDKTIGIQFNHDTNFSGRIFTSRMERNPMCVQHYSPTSPRNRFEVPLNALTCGVKSSKKTFPNSGLEYSVNIVLSYNHMFLTEDDLIYNVKCDFPSAEKAVGTMYEADLLMKPATPAVGEIASPTCNYSLHINSIDGPTARKAQIGQKVFHKWQCDTSQFSMKVYRCYVHNGQHKKYLLVDDDGCSLDPAILPELVYNKDLNYVYATSSVFRFTDTSKVFFRCLLYICPKGEPSCEMNIPPKCHSRNRRHSDALDNLLTVAGHSIRVQSPEIDSESSSSALCELTTYNRTAFVILVISNFVSLFIASLAILYMYRRHFSAQLNIQ